uniref:Uncharacterized protein n=1 Tax=Arundo donax TaxID=35708 RepID=A0A0A9A6T9_ARUDO
MVVGNIIRSCRLFNCCIKLWTFHYLSILPWSISWHYIFSSSIQTEEISSCCFSYHCNGARFSSQLWRILCH